MCTFYNFILKNKRYSVNPCLNVHASLHFKCVSLRLTAPIGGMVFKLGLPMIRTMQSKLVEPQEQGNKLNLCVCVCARACMCDLQRCDIRIYTMFKL